MKNYRRAGNLFKRILSIPFIYLVFFPLVLLDAIVELYHRISFPLYEMPLVVRRLYIRIDRHKLSYLKPVQRFNCVYCGYANGLLAYAKEIANRTESYWCNIQHAHEEELLSVDHHKNFLLYGDEEAYRAMSSTPKVELIK